MENKPYFIKDMYQGNYSSFEPTPLSQGNYPIQTGSLSITTDPRSANILQTISAAISGGIKNVEVTAVTPDYFDSIPKQHIKEVKRLAELTGIDMTVHGPVVDVSGINPRQGGFSEAGRELAQKKVLQTLERSHDLNPKGNILVNFHSAEGLEGSEFGPKRTEDGERIYKKIIAVNRETGRMIPLEKEKRFYPKGYIPPEVKTGYEFVGKHKTIRKKYFTPEENLLVLNETEWDNSLDQLFFNKERADEILERNRPLIQHLVKDYNAGKINIKDLQPTQQQVLERVTDAQNYLSDIHRNVNSLFSKAYRYGNERQKEILDDVSKEFTKKIELVKKDKFPDPFAESRVMKELLFNLKDPRLDLAPKMHVPIEDFALEKTAKTFGGAAFSSYKKFGDTSPVLVIENPPAGFALSTGEDIKNMVIESRKNFVKRSVKEGISESEAKHQAEKLIGATWDVGHINMLRKFGYDEKDIIKEAEIVAPFVKHVHLSDNFGFEHTELPMGMGNVPLKEVMDKLGKKGFEAKKVIEAAQWWTHFKTSPFQPSIEEMGTPIYSGGVAPYWSQNLGLQQDYYGGYGLMLPSVNYETFGAGFSRLPAELGGNRQGASGARMSGNPME